MKLSRNAPCPCGSGKKYKRCCGKNENFVPVTDIDGMLQRGLQELQQGHFAQAEPLLRAVHRASPTNAEACNLLGIICAQTGRLDEATALLSRAVKYAPNDAQSHYNLGNTYSACGRYDEAIAAYKMALKLQPNIAEAENNLGMALSALHRPEEAKGHFDKAKAINPSYGPAYENLGNVLLQLDDVEAAVDALERAYSLLPKTAVLLNNLANAYAASGQTKKAFKYYDQAIQKEDNAEILMNKAKLALNNSLYSLAVETLEKVLQYTPEDPAVLFLLFDAQEGLGQYEAACDSLNRARDLGFSPSLTEVCLGNICSRIGDFEQAVHHFETALKLDPSFSSAFASIAQVTKSGYRSGLVEKIEETLRNIELPVETRIQLNFSLGKQYNDAHLFDQAFASYRKGNELRFQRDYQDYDVVEFRDQVSSLIDFFTTDFFDSFSAYGSQSERPIIIFGMPRSGTTLTEQILAGHSQVFGAGELSFFGSLKRKAEREGNEWPTCLGIFDRKRFADMAKDYLDLLDSFATDKERVSNKMPHNFIAVGLIYLLFPNAQFIHCTRQPIDNCLSIYFQNFGGNHPYAYDLKTLGEYYTEYRRLVDHWREVLPAPIFEMSYEKTVDSISERAKELIEFCKLPWEDACLDFHKTKRVVKTASIWQVRQKVYTSSVDRWRNYEAHLLPLVEALGPFGSA